MKNLFRMVMFFLLLILIQSDKAGAEDSVTRRIIVLPYNSQIAGDENYIDQILPDRMDLYFNHSGRFSCIDSGEWKRVADKNFNTKKPDLSALKALSGLHADYILFGSVYQNRVVFYLYNNTDGTIKSREIAASSPDSFGVIESLISWLKNDIGGDFREIDNSAKGLSVLRYSSKDAYGKYLKVLYGTKNTEQNQKPSRQELAFLESLSREDPTFLSGRELYASALLSSGNIKKAKSEYEQILKTNSDFIPALIGMAIIFDAEGQPDKSSEYIFREAGRDMPPLLLYNYALFLGKAGNLGKSQEAYEALLQKDPYHKAARINLASMLFSLNNYDEALEIYESLKRDYPDELMTDYTISSIFMRKGELGKARGILLDLSEKGKFKEVYNDLGIIARREEEYDTAESLLKKALEVDPSYYPAHNNLGILYSIQNKNEEALKCFNEALRINPSSSDALFNLGIISYKTGDLNRAWVYFSRAATVSPGFTRAKMNLAIIEMKRGNMAGAEKLLLKCAEESPADALVHYNLGVLYRSMGRYRQAANAFRKAIFSSPDMADAANNIGAILIREKQYEEAAEWIDKALALSPEDSVYLFNRGLTEFYRENYDRAADYFLNALLNDKDSSRINQYLITSLLEDGRYEQAERHIEYMRATYPDNLEFEYQRAVFLERTGRDKQAAETLEKLIDKGYIPDAARNLGMLYVKMHEYDKAAKMFRDLLALDPKDTRTLNEVGKTYVSAGMNQDALNAFLKVLEIDPKNKTAYIYTGDIYIKENNLEKAEALYAKAASVFPDETDFIFNQALCLYYQEKPEKALDIMQKAVEKAPENAKYHYTLALINKKLNKRNNMLRELKTTFDLNPAYKQEFLRDEDFKDLRNDKDVFKLLGD